MKKLFQNHYGRNLLIESPQPVFFKYALCNTVGKRHQQLTTFAQCRDYLSDVAMATIFDKVAFPPIYGFHWQHSKELSPAVGGSFLVLLMKCEGHTKFMKNLAFLQEYEKYMGYLQTEVQYEYQTQTGYVKIGIESDRRYFAWWGIISLYSLLLRAMVDTVLKPPSSGMHEDAMAEALLSMPFNAKDRFQYSGTVLENCPRLIGLMYQYNETLLEYNDLRINQDMFDGIDVSAEDIQYAIHNGAGISSIGGLMTENGKTWGERSLQKGPNTGWFAQIPALAIHSHL